MLYGAVDLMTSSKQSNVRISQNELKRRTSAIVKKIMNLFIVLRWNVMESSFIYSHFLKEKLFWGKIV